MCGVLPVNQEGFRVDYMPKSARSECHRDRPVYFVAVDGW